MYKYLFILAVSSITLFSNCGSKQTSVSSYYSTEPECMESELDGTETILTWGRGKNKADAKEQAKKNAIYAVLFEGIRQGNKSCSRRPLITEVNAREKYEDYFNNFLKDGGQYKKFVSESDKKGNSEVRSNNIHDEKIGFVIRVKRADLKQQLIKDNIIK